MAVVELKNVCKAYEGGHGLAVDNVSLRVEHGEFMVLLGPSGCGKSTTLRMIAGLEKITSGTLSIDERVVNDVAAKDRDIAMVFQSYALYPHMKVRDNLAFGLRRRGVDRVEIERRVSRTAAMLGLSTLLDRKPFALSGGQRQRVALGRAIVREPKVFLFDEPLSNLDTALRASTRNELIRQHQALAATMIYVTHDQVEAMTMGQRICIIDQGKVVQVGPPLAVYRDPANTFVASFLGNPPMNLLAAELVRDGGGLAVRLGDVSLPMVALASAGLEAFVGKPVTFGIRPEDIYLAGEMPQDRRQVAKVQATVSVVESLGAETILMLAREGERRLEFAARVGRDAAPRPGGRLELLLDLAAVHLFDPATGNAVGSRITA
ncbi:MAG: ABC transporter ATP-binding protein [Pseudomonadota bacterium]|nr:ABC transporter ATP-binding protein [Pseudomonadota bacterium]